MTSLETAPQRRRGKRRNRPGWLSRYGTLVAFLALIVFNIVVTPNFLSWQTLNVNLTQVATIVIVAVGMTLVIATGGIDLSVGSLMAISGALAPMIFLGTIVPIDTPVLAVALAFTVPVIVAAAVRLVQRHADHPLFDPADRGDAGAVHRRARHRAGADQRQSAGVQERGLPVHRAWPRRRHPDAGDHHGVVVAAAAFLIRSTALGRQIIAVGGNEKAARLAGIPARRSSGWSTSSAARWPASPA